MRHLVRTLGIVFTLAGSAASVWAKAPSGRAERGLHGLRARYGAAILDLAFRAEMRVGGITAPKASVH